MLIIVIIRCDKMIIHSMQWKSKVFFFVVSILFTRKKKICKTCSEQQTKWIWSVICINGINYIALKWNCQCYCDSSSNDKMKNTRGKSFDHKWNKKRWHQMSQTIFFLYISSTQRKQIERKRMLKKNWKYFDCIDALRYARQQTTQAKNETQRKDEKKMKSKKGKSHRDEGDVHEIKFTTTNKMPWKTKRREKTPKTREEKKKWLAVSVWIVWLPSASSLFAFTWFYSIGFVLHSNATILSDIDVLIVAKKENNFPFRQTKRPRFDRFRIASVCMCVCVHSKTHANTIRFVCARPMKVKMVETHRILCAYKFRAYFFVHSRIHFHFRKSFTVFWPRALRKIHVNLFWLLELFS